MRRMVLRATDVKSTRALVVTSPASTTRLALTSVSAATRERGSWARIASSTASEIWSATLSGWPSDTDSDVNRKSLIACAPEKRPQGYQILRGFPRFLLRLAAILPLRVLHAVGTVLGWAVYGISPTYRANLRANLAQAGYADSRTRRCAIAAAGQMLAELPVLWFRPYEKVTALVREATGVEAAYAARERGEALLFLTPHLGCFEITAQYAARRMPITVLYRPPRLGWLEPLMREGRERPNVRLVPAGVHAVPAVVHG